MPFRVAPYVIPSAIEPVEELMIVSLPLTEDAVEGEGIRFENAAEAGRARGPGHARPMDAGHNPARAVRVPERGRNRTSPAQALTGLRKESRPSSAKLDSLIAKSLLREW